MSRVNPLILFGFLLAVLAILGGADAMKGAFLIDRHEGDTLHLLEILFRMDAGEWPHKDFMTPIGILAFAPVLPFLRHGVGVGESLIYSQILMAAVLLPMVWWASYSRLKGAMAYVFGLFVMVLVLALVHGEAERAISISMHYNRWAWAFSYVALLLAVLPPRESPRPVLDGGIIGLCLAALVLLKVTYFLAFFPPVLVALVEYKSRRCLISALLAGLVVAAVVTLVAGFDFWFAYLNDLLTVAHSEVRPKPGVPFKDIVSAPRFLGATLTALLGVLLLRQGQRETAGLLLLLLFPGFTYVTYQNFGNDPQWLLLLALLLFAFAPDKDLVNRWGWNLRNVANMAGAAALALSLPSFFNMAVSPFRHLAKKTAEYTPLVPDTARTADLMTLKIRAARVNGEVALYQDQPFLQKYAKMAKRDKPGKLLGKPLARCELSMGLPAWMETITQDMETADLIKGKRLLATDLLSSYWLYSDQLLPLKSGAPWYYGGLPGIESADYVLVPLCPMSRKVRRIMLDEIAARPEIKLKEVRRTPLYVLLAVQHP